MKVTTASIKKHFQDNAKTYGIIAGTTLLAAAFGSVTNEMFDYDHGSDNSLVGAGFGFITGCALALMYNAEH